MTLWFEVVFVFALLVFELAVLVVPVFAFEVAFTFDPESLVTLIFNPSALVLLASFLLTGVLVVVFPEVVFVFVSLDSEKTNHAIPPRMMIPITMRTIFIKLQ